MNADSITIWGNLVFPPIGLLVGHNIAIYEKTIERLSSDPLRYDQYEKLLKDKKRNSTRDFFEYYGGMPGRFFAYKTLRNPKNWK